jgi:hypothetical protein
MIERWVGWARSRRGAPWRRICTGESPDAVAAELTRLLGDWVATANQFITAGQKPPEE